MCIKAIFSCYANILRSYICPANWAAIGRDVLYNRISNQVHPLANVNRIHLAEKVIPNVDAILWEAEKVKWLTSTNRDEAQHGLGIN